MRFQLNVERLKNRARKLELKDQPQKAIEVYQDIIGRLEGTPDMSSELGLYNKVGDLYLKVRNVNSAVEMYERAADQYTEAGFPNNAIALCNKILRSAPGRTHVYLKLAQLMLQRRFTAEAKRNLVEYASRMADAGKFDSAFDALRQFADLSPDKEEFRVLLAEQLRAHARDDEARDQIDRFLAQAKGEDAERTAKSSEADDDDEAAGDRGGRSEELIFLDLTDDRPTGDVASDLTEEPPAPVDIEPTSVGEEVSSSEANDGVVVERVTSALESDEVREAAPVDGLEGPTEVDLDDDDVDPENPIDIERTSLVEGDDPTSDLDFLGAQAATSEGGLLDLPVPTLDVGNFGSESLSEPSVIPDPLGASSLDLGSVPGELNVDEVFDAPPTESDATWLDSRASAAWDSPPTEPQSPSETTDSHDEDAGMSAMTSDAVEIEPPDELDELTNVGFDDSDQPPVVEPDEAHHAFDELESSSEVEEGSAVEWLEASDVTPTDLESGENLDDVLPLVDPVGDAVEIVDDTPSLAELEARVEQNPDDAQVRRTYAEALLESGDLEGGLAALDQSLAAYEAAEDWGHATAVVDEMIRIDPNKVDYHQRRVELAHRRGDQAALITGSLDLGNALFRSGELDKAQSVYQQVLDHDPSNESAREALAAFSPPEAAASATDTDVSAPTAAPESNGGDYVDLSDFIMGDDFAKRNTRMRVEDEERTGDEQQDFNEMLQQFRRGIEENLDEGDAQAHYDLGVAFKEMALLDEAISEFQKALRNSDTRLQSAEMLGLCFIEKGQFEVAATVLRRGIDRDEHGDEDKVGLLYWLGRCEEEQGRPEEALRNYRRVFAIDIRFEDVARRVEDLVKAGS